MTLSDGGEYRFLSPNRASSFHTPICDITNTTQASRKDAMIARASLPSSDNKITTRWLVALPVTHRPPKEDLPLSPSKYHKR